MEIILYDKTNYSLKICELSLAIQLKKFKIWKKRILKNFFKNYQVNLTVFFAAIIGKIIIQIFSNKLDLKKSLKRLCLSL
jgi:hypothetical protein